MVSFQLSSAGRLNKGNERLRRTVPKFSVGKTNFLLFDCNMVRQSLSLWFTHPLLEQSRIKVLTSESALDGLGKSEVEHQSAQYDFRC